MAGRNMYDRVIASCQPEDNRQQQGAVRGPEPSSAAVMLGAGLQKPWTGRVAGVAAPTATPLSGTVDIPQLGRTGRNAAGPSLDPGSQAVDKVTAPSAYQRQRRPGQKEYAGSGSGSWRQKATQPPRNGQSASKNAISSSGVTSTPGSPGSPGSPIKNRSPQHRRRRSHKKPVPAPPVPGASISTGQHGAGVEKTDGGTGAAGKAGSPGSSDVTESPPPPPLAQVPGWSEPADESLICGQRYDGKKISFCPWKVVANYHHWFVGKQNSERIRTYFETQALLQCQAWRFYYAWNQTEAAPLRGKGYAVVVPTHQFQHLLDRINHTLGTSLTIPKGPTAYLFRVTFGEQGTPLPRFLAWSTDAMAKERLEGAGLPPLDPQDAVYSLAKFTPKVRESYVNKVSNLMKSHDRNQRKRDNAGKTRERHIRNRRLWGRQIKRIQRYLGLRKKLDKDSDAKGVIVGEPLRTWDLNRPPPFSPEDDVIFVSMDIESFEFNHNMVTEIGLGILDTRRIVGRPPGLQCSTWHSLIQARHIRVKEHAYAVNRVHVQGCENHFQFGASEFVKKGNVRHVLQSVLQPPGRKVVLVGHGISNDVSLVKHVGYEIKPDGMFVEIVDTQDVHRHYRALHQQTGLAAMLRDLGIEYQFLHNGGNDAVYTLQALISLAVVQRQKSLERHISKAQGGDSAAPTTPTEEDEGWNSGGELSDGGFPAAGSNDVPADAEAAAPTKQKAADENQTGPDGLQGFPRLSLNPSSSPKLSTATVSLSAGISVPTTIEEDLILF